MSTQTKVIKRYANRKLYDTDRSCYVTLDDIALMIKAGDDVRVVDNKSGEDLTSVTLAQIIFEAEKKRSFMPLNLLRDLIQGGGEQITDFAKSRLDAVKGSAQEVQKQAQQQVQQIKERAEKLRVDLEGRIKQPDGKLKVVGEVQKALEDLQKGVEERVKGGMGLVGRELEELRKRIAELEERLGKSE
ncbi:MAG: polyhydroxyalkanoate synthesis regulator DNA-binding domain-containing protein [Rhodospirillales bacterium]|nr:polyhydroxyalkanoate synthesis regulator DNA-binding domain-containing protein [Rhodospirillales bacterium]